jgi:hypothetical protein
MNHRPEDPDTGQAGPDASWLTGLLDDEAGRYAPDSGRIRAAMHQRMRGGRHSALARVRPSRTTAGIVTAVLAAAAAVAVTVTVETRPAPAGLPSAAASGRPPLASPPSAGGSPGKADGGATQSTAGNRPLPKPTPTPSPSAASVRAGANPVSATGTNDLGAFPYWLQEQVSVSLRAPVTALQLKVTVARSALVASTGYWTTYDPAVFDVTVAAQSSTLTYTFTLKPGQTLPAGNSAFAVQFNHGTDPHDPAGDTYALSVTSDGQNAAVQGTAAGEF